MPVTWETLPASFFQRIAPSDEGACWAWTGYRNYAGYGIFTLRGRSCRAHRLVYEAFVGPIPDGLQIDHLCRNRACVNPQHLEAVTNQVNTIRAVPFRKPTPPRGPWSTPRRESCRNGHQRTPGNFKVNKRGAVVCLECERIRDRRRYRDGRHISCPK